MFGYFFSSETKFKSEPCLRCVSVMITRLLLSLKKADASREYDWSLEEITTHTTMGFAGHRGVATRDEILLDTFASAHEGTRGRG